MLVGHAATSTADDGSPPCLDDPEKIATVSWKHYHTLVSTYRIEAFGWPMNNDGSMKDPSNLGIGHGEMEKILEDVKSGKRGFRRLTNNAWKEAMAEYDAAVENGTVVPTTRRVRSDKGTTRKRKKAPTGSTQQAKKVCDTTIY